MMISPSLATEAERARERVRMRLEASLREFLALHASRRSKKQMGGVGVQTR